MHIIFPSDIIIGPKTQVHGDFREQSRGHPKTVVWTLARFALKAEVKGVPIPLKENGETASPGCCH